MESFFGAIHRTIGTGREKEKWVCIYVAGTLGVHSWFGYLWQPINKSPTEFNIVMLLSLSCEAMIWLCTCQLVPHPGSELSIDKPFLLCAVYLTDDKGEMIMIVCVGVKRVALSTISTLKYLLLPVLLAASSCLRISAIMDQPITDYFTALLRLITFRDEKASCYIFKTGSSIKAGSGNSKTKFVGDWQEQFDWEGIWLAFQPMLVIYPRPSFAPSWEVFGNILLSGWQSGGARGSELYTRFPPLSMTTWLSLDILEHQKLVLAFRRPTRSLAIRTFCGDWSNWWNCCAS